MKNLKFGLPAILGVLATLVSNIAAASSAATITLSAVPPGSAVGAGAASASGASPIPTMGDAMLIVLAMVLMVIAVRVFRSGETQKRLMSLLLVSSAAVVGGLGVDSVNAGMVFEVFTIDSDPPCNGDTPIVIPVAFPNSSNTVTNSCPNGSTLTIDSFDFWGCLDAELDKSGGRVGPGDSIAPAESKVLATCSPT